MYICTTVSMYIIVLELFQGTVQRDFRPIVDSYCYLYSKFLFYPVWSQYTNLKFENNCEFLTKINPLVSVPGRIDL